MSKVANVIELSEARAASRAARVARPASNRCRTCVAVGVVADVLAVAAGYLLAATVRAPLPEYWSILPWTIAIWPIAFAMSGLYDYRRLTGGAEEMRRIFHAGSMSMFVVILMAFLSDQGDLSRGWTAVAWPSCLLSVALVRLLLRRMVYAMRNRGRLRSPVAIVGTNDEARAIARTLIRNRWVGYDPVGFVRVSNGRPDHDEDESIDGIPVIGWTSRIGQAVREAGVGAVIVASSGVPPEKLDAVYRDLQYDDIDVRISAGVLNIAASRMTVERLDGFPVLALRRMQLPRGQALVKRAFDVAGAALALAVAMPAMIAIAIAVRTTSRGPMLFKQVRIGLDGRPFHIYKFRTMLPGSEDRVIDLMARNEADGLLFKVRDDPRITPVGRFLRRWSLDELPQLVNVLRGEMSLVGPRPPLPQEAVRYDGWLRGRLQVRPGITGLWQVSGRHELTFDDYVRYDLFYVRNWSIALDLSILWRTLPAVLSRRGSW